jgi:hypothetical protein
MPMKRTPANSFTSAELSLRLIAACESGDNLPDLGPSSPLLYWHS